MAAEYSFLDRWVIPASAEEVFEALADVRSYPDWWGDVYLEAEGDPPPAEPGKRWQVKARGFLPYRLRYTLECTEADPPWRLASKAQGDFEGTAVFQLKPVDGGTEVLLDWRPRVEKPVVRALTPVLRPLFRANHTWSLRKGERGLKGRLAERVERSA